MNALRLGTPTTQSVVAAFCSVLLVLLWQALTVRYSYNGNRTGLFCTGALFPPPPALDETIYLFPNSTGYDGQFYHDLAHDPFFQRNFAGNIDDPRLRSRRILLPVLAFALALGQDRAVDFAYILTVAAFIFLGSYWTARIALPRGYPAVSGILFCAVPAVLISIDRMTVDVALAACCAGFVFYVNERSHDKLYLVLAAAALIRETGLLLIAAFVIWLLGAREFRKAAWFSTTALPAACWYIFVQLHTPPDDSAFISPIPFAGFIHRLSHPMNYPFTGELALAAHSLDALALAGIAAALCWTFYRASRKVRTPVTIAIYLYALLAITLSNPDAWSEVYAFGRSLTPLLLLSAFDGLAAGALLPLAAMLALDPRLVLQMGGQIIHVARGITGH